VAKINVCCPQCKSDDVVKHGVTAEEKQRYQCKNIDCSKNTFLLDYSYHACSPGIKDKIVDMALNGSGIRDTARVLGINMNTVMSELKKKKQKSKM
jgi:transposase-like protein